MSARGAPRAVPRGSGLAPTALLAAAVAIALGACAPLLPAPTERAADAAWEARRAALARITAWHAVGRLSLQTSEQAWHASLVWEETPGGYRVRLSGPLGQGAIEIRGAPGGVTLRTARGETYEAADPETLMQRTLGWSVPLGGLRYWILGRDDPGAGPVQRSLDPVGRPLALSQAGWEVQYLAYLPGEPVELPGRVQLDRGDLQARLVISRWDLDPR